MSLTFGEFADVVMQGKIDPKQSDGIYLARCMGWGETYGDPRLEFVKPSGDRGFGYLHRVSPWSRGQDMHAGIEKRTRTESRHSRAVINRLRPGDAVVVRDRPYAPVGGGDEVRFLYPVLALHPQDEEFIGRAVDNEGNDLLTRIEDAQGREVSWEDPWYEEGFVIRNVVISEVRKDSKKQDELIGIGQVPLEKEKYDGLVYRTVKVKGETTLGEVLDVVVLKVGTEILLTHCLR